MSVRITLTETNLPPSAQFLDFLDRWQSGAGFDGSNWATYGQERATPLSRNRAPGTLAGLVERVAGSDDGMRWLGRAYELFVALLIGDVEALAPLHRRFRFVLIVGAPRTGGKYLTKELFRALGHEPAAIPAVLAHDGFPEAGPWRFDRSGNSWIESLQTMAEYLAMVELFFPDMGPPGERMVIPKKATKAVYAPGLFHSALGPDTEWIVTLRHPVPACISAYEAAGGLPEDGRFHARSNVEILLARDLLAGGLSRDEIAAMDYFDAYLRYWEDFHLRLSLGGIAGGRRPRVVAYGADRIGEMVRENAIRFGRTVPVEAFQARDRRDRHPDWIARAEPALLRVRAQWGRAGLEFPWDAIAECQ